MPPRPQIEPTDDWHQIALLARAPGQRAYELIRPVVLFGQSPAERAAETGAAARTVHRQVARFEQLGLAGLVPPPKVEKHRTLPAEVRQAILDAKREHPPLTARELTRICWARCGHRPSPHTVKRILAENPPPPRTHRRFPPYHGIADPIQRRLAVVRLHVEGWNATSIAAYLETSRQTVHATLKRWAEEEFAGLADKSRAPHRRGTKVTLRAIVTVKELQENPLLGEFRIHAALKRLGIFLSPRTCGRILALNRALYGLPQPERTPREATPMPFKAARRHQYWSADIRYIDHGLGDFKVYSVTILDNYSRAVVASGLSRTQDLGAFDGAVRGDPTARGAGGTGDRRREHLPGQAATNHPLIASASPSSRSPAAKPGRTTSRRTSGSSDGSPIGGLRGRASGRSCWPSRTTGSPSTTTRTIPPTRTDPKTGTGCAGSSSTPRSCTASSTARVAAGCWTGRGMPGSGTGACMPRAAWAGRRSRSGRTPST
jgi:transposase